MSWKPYHFKGQKIFARVDESGKLVVEHGRVEIKFRSSSRARIYRAAKRNVKAIPEANEPTNNAKNDQQNNKIETPSPQKTQPTSKKKKSSSKKKSNRRSKSSASQKTSNTPTNIPKRKTSLDDSIWKNPLGERLISTQTPESLLQLKPPEKGIWEIYTDGACSGNPGPCGSGIVIRYGNFYQEISQYIGLGTNNIAELYAILIALELLKETNSKGTIYTDSDLCIGLLTLNWKAKANQDLVSKCKDTMKGLSVSFVKVKGHSGIPQNERADRMAVQAVKRKN